MSETHEGWVVATAGRRVVVADSVSERVCFLAGHRAVVGDRVLWVAASGEGGKLVAVHERTNALIRTDERGREQVLAANIAGLLVVCAPSEPPFRAGLLDRYLVAAGVAGLQALVVLNKVDQGIPDDVATDLALRAATGVEILYTSTVTGAGVDALRERIRSDEAPWCLVGHSGTGKTSVAGALLPGVDVGEIGHLSEYWGQGRHTTTGSRWFSMPGGGGIVDSPGIRTFAPGQLGPEAVRDYFPGFDAVHCRYRDCLHREGEQGCDAPEGVPPALLISYRRLLDEIVRIDARATEARYGR